MKEVGAIPVGESRCRFVVWAPTVEGVVLKLISPCQNRIPLRQTELGYWEVGVSGVVPGTRYCFEIDGQSYPDPASRHQPDGVHGSSAVVDHRQFNWRDGDWRNLPLADYVIYELHVGTFTPAGTFNAIVERLPALKALGVTAIEIMPVAQFPGQRNWGYDGVYPYAVQNSYGGPGALKQLVEACHRQGLAVILDVVYNHFGPEGNYTGNFAPYTTDKYVTPWGGAINFDDAWSGGVRDYCIQNALAWLRDYHIDALRLDAVHAMYDLGARHFLSELSEQVDALSDSLEKPHYLIAESDLNDARVIRDRNQGGYGIHAQWSDDFHHALHALLTGEANGYYQDFGSCEALATALRERFVYGWKYSTFRKRRHGSAAHDLPNHQFVVCAQNHDQVGNRILGERLTQLISFEGLKLAAGILLTSPYVPLLFMGEEYGETAPFLYFVDHGDPDLLEAVRLGRAKEFKDYQLESSPPAADSPVTFKKSILNWELRTHGQHQQLLSYYQRLLQLRKQLRLGHQHERDQLTVFSEESCRVVYYQRRTASGYILCLMNFSHQPSQIQVSPLQDLWQKQLDSTAYQWRDQSRQESDYAEDDATLPDFFATGCLTLPPRSFVLYTADPHTPLESLT